MIWLGGERNLLWIPRPILWKERDDPYKLSSTSSLKTNGLNVHTHAHVHAETQINNTKIHIIAVFYFKNFRIFYHFLFHTEKKIATVDYKTIFLNINQTSPN